ncbi:MAG TPA: penicillin acylase family protein [Acidimicrobiia bacterium]|nr:penicillin acylase family protein [Acidimicrobiia bacterium]
MSGRRARRGAGTTRRTPLTRRGVRIAAALVAGALIAAACSGSNGSDSAGDAETVGVKPGPNGYAAKIRRTTDGVPHVIADNVAGLGFGQGWAAAEDHACSLADQIVRVTSTRARWLGPGEDSENIESDFQFLALGVAARAEADWKQASKADREIITSFADGWDAYLDDVGSDGLDGWCAGEPWVRPITPLELYIYSRWIPLLASGGALLDFVGSAQPPGASAPPAGGDEAALGAANTAPIASNGWAIGSKRTDGDGGLLLANPHFPWEGPLRFWEVQLTIPDELDVYGAQLLGLPGVGIGFTDGVAWTHTVSDGNRFTAYTLDLTPGDPTSYLLDGEPQKMTSHDESIEIAQPDGSMTTEERTLWDSEYGPLLDFPGVGWSAEQAATYRDANIDNTALVSQYLAMDRAESLDDLQAAQRKYQAVPLFNTIAVGADGRAWYADTSATPNLSPESIEAYEQRVADGGITALAADSGAVLLDGSSSRDAWVDVPGARSPGLIPWSGFPMTERRDYVFNANDSFWLPNATHFIEGDYSPLHGEQRTVRSRRTRQNATVLSDTSPDGAAGEDGKFTLDELKTAALQDGGFTAEETRDAIVQRCQAGAGVISLPAEPPVDPGDNEGRLPAADIDITEACEVLASWDGLYNVDSRGAHLWRELIVRAGNDLLFVDDFDANEPIATPTGPVPAPADQVDPILEPMARAVQAITTAGFALDAPLGDLQIDGRVPDQRLPVPGGTGTDGVTNVVDNGGSSFGSSEPIPANERRVSADSRLTSLGYTISAGTSFLMAVEYSDDGPRAASILTYGETGNRESPLFTSQVKKFAKKQWKPVLFTTAEINHDPDLAVTTVRG